jgi:hypothetical protein
VSDLREAFEALENLRKWADDHPAGIEDEVETWHSAVQAALSANGGEAPVGWMWEAYGQRNFTAGCHHKEVLESDGVVMTPLYTHPVPPSVAVPEGWKLVPIEPTALMMDAACHAYGGDDDWLFHNGHDVILCHRAMVNAAPSPDHSGDAGKVVSGNEVKARVVSGARDMLRESGKQFRAIGDIGHAAMCENHADELDRLRTTDDKAEGV